MQINIETDYSIRAMVYLRNNAGKPSPIGDIAAGVAIPPAFLSKIMQKLVRSGLVSSKKGKTGGFTLAGDPDKVTMLDIVTAACGEDRLLRTTCRRSGKLCGFHKDCRVHGVWENIGGMMRMMLQANRLSQL